MSIDPASTAKAVTFVVKTAEELGLFEKAKDVFKPKHAVLLLGASGVGKTNLVKAIVSELPGSIDHSDRTELKSPPTKIKIDSAYFLVEDTPGHDKGKADAHPWRLEAIRAAKKSRISGIINVVANGYHETRYLQTPSFKDGKPSPEFVNNARRIEIERLSEWVDALGHEHTIQWVLTVVNKADCWWSAKTEVLSHYEKGPYAQALKLDSAVEHAVLPFACEQRRFWDEGHVDPEFDDKVRALLRKQLIDSLVVLSKRKKT